MEKVPNASNRLIDILTSCGRDEGAVPSTTQLSSNDVMSGSKRAHSELFEDEDSFRTETPPGLLGFSSPTMNTIATHFDFLRKPAANTANSQPKPVAKRTRDNESTSPTYADLLSPAKMTLLFCYVSLLVVYHSNFYPGISYSPKTNTCAHDWARSRLRLDS